MNTTRHDFTLVFGRNKIHICAPRMFSYDDKIRYIHIADPYCQFVQIFDHLQFINNTCVQVAVANILKLHSNSKGLFFNYSYWVSDEKKENYKSLYLRLEVKK